MPRTKEHLTTESLVRFIGGEAEIRSQFEDYLYRGEIAEIGIDRKILIIKFAWLVKNHGGPFGGKKGPSPDWNSFRILDYSAGLDVYGVSDIGDGQLTLDSSLLHETLVLFPADGSKMNPTGIHGLPESVIARLMEKHRQWEKKSKMGT